jgi:hypothetical protein
VAVYFAKAPRGPIKIGRSNWLVSRLTAQSVLNGINGSNGPKLRPVLLALIGEERPSQVLASKAPPGFFAEDIAMEARTHRRFAHIRSRHPHHGREMFVPTAELWLAVLEARLAQPIAAARLVEFGNVTGICVASVDDIEAELLAAQAAESSRAA